MFSRKKDAAKISDRNPVFHVRYIGCTETFTATGRGCSYAPVQRLWDNSPAEKNMRKVAVHISINGLTLKDQTTDKPPTPTTTTPPHHPHHQRHQHHHQDGHHESREFDIENISFCNVDRAVNERIFSWIYRERGTKRLDCHAVLCSTAQKAQVMAIVLSRAFQIAYKDWRAHHRHYDPPVNRSPSSSTSSRNSSRNAKDTKQSRNFDATPSSAMPVAASQPTSSVTSSLTSSAEERKEQNIPLSTTSASAEENRVTSSWNIRHTTTASPSPPPRQKRAHFYDDVAAARPADDVSVTSPVSAQQQSATSSFFVSSCIWDPDMDRMMAGVDCLQADLDLEDHSNDENMTAF